jgi:hypothetical protein
MRAVFSQDTVRSKFNAMAVVYLAFAFLAGSACAQTHPAEQQASTEELRLPDRMMGLWAPYGEGWQDLGELRIAPETLTWGNCLYEEYVVDSVNEEKKSYVVELARSPPCRINVFAPFLLFEFSEQALKISDQALEVSICREKAQLEQPPGRRSCSRVILLKKS